VSDYGAIEIGYKRYRQRARIAEQIYQFMLIAIGERHIPERFVCNAAYGFPIS
jgi:hypothetical protein